MRVVVAPDTFKGSLDARTAAAAIAAGVASVAAGAQCDLAPMADGGEGTLEAFLSGPSWERVRVVVQDPLGRRVGAEYGWNAATRTAMVESAQASGLTLLERPDADERDPWRASTYGTGELLRAALDRGARTIVLGVGGSATTDGGAGALAALGVRFLDAAGTLLSPQPAALRDALVRVDASAFDGRAASVALRIASDVDDPLTGPRGAARMYGAQKGIAPNDTARFDALLTRLADAVEAAGGACIRDEPGSGAAGGLAWGLRTLWPAAELVAGGDLVARELDLPALLTGAALCLTGEGRIDEGTLSGKVVARVAAFSREARVPVVAFGGAVDPQAEARLARELGVVCVPIVAAPTTLAAALDPERAEANLRVAAARAVRLFLLRAHRGQVDAAGAAGVPFGKRTYEAR